MSDETVSAFQYLVLYQWKFTVISCWFYLFVRLQFLIKYVSLVEIRDKSHETNFFSKYLHRAWRTLPPLLSAMTNFFFHTAVESHFTESAVESQYFNYVIKISIYNIDVVPKLNIVIFEKLGLIFNFLFRR